MGAPLPFRATPSPPPGASASSASPSRNPPAPLRDHHHRVNATDVAVDGSGSRSLTWLLHRWLWRGSSGVSRLSARRPTTRARSSTIANRRSTSDLQYPFAVIRETHESERHNHPGRSCLRRDPRRLQDAQHHLGYAQVRQGHGRPLRQPRNRASSISWTTIRLPLGTTR